MRILQRLWHPLLALLRGLRALVQLPSQLRQWHIRLETQELLIRELTDLHRELLYAIGSGPQTPETPRLNESNGPLTRPTATAMDLLPPDQISRPLELTDPAPPNPKRLRTSRDVTYSSRSFLREQDERAVAEQAPWRRPGRS